MHDVQAALLIGGLGTRIRSVLSDRPKALAPVCGRPVITFLLDQLVKAGVQSAVLCTGHLGDMVEAALGQAYGPLELLYSRETKPLGTGGALRLALPQVTAETLLVMNGDSWCNVDLTAFEAEHRRTQARLSLVLTEVPDAARFGRVSVDADGRIERFEEKNSAGGAGLINAGIYLMSRADLETLPPDAAVSLEREVFPAWIAQGCAHGFIVTGKFLDIGTPETLAAAQDFFRDL